MCPIPYYETMGQSKDPRYLRLRMVRYAQDQGNKPAARRICLLIDYSEGARLVRQPTVAPASNNDLRLFEAARSALSRALPRRVCMRHLRLIADRLTYPSGQMDLFEDMQRNAEDRLIQAIDAVRSRFGPHRCSRNSANSADG